MPCSAASFRPLIAALTCTRARSARYLATPRATSTSKPCVVWAIFLPGPARRRRAFHEELVPANLFVVLAGNRSVRDADHPGGGGIPPATEPHMDVARHHLTGRRGGYLRTGRSATTARISGKPGTDATRPRSYLR